MFTGKVYHYVKTELGDIEFVETATHIMCSVVVGSQTVIKFPVAKNSDNNTIARIASVIVGQSGLVNNPVVAEVTETS